MTLIVAIEPDRRQAHYLSAMVRHRLNAELLLAESADEAIRALEGRVPDVILTSALLSPKDESVLAEWLRTLDTAAAHVQTLTIPVFSTARPRAAQRVRGMFASFLGSTTVEDEPGSPDGCDPAMFAEQCADYLERARAQRADNGDPIEYEEPPQADVPVETFEEPAEPEARVHAMNATEVVAQRPPEEFVEFDLSHLFDSVDPKRAPASDEDTADPSRDEEDDGPGAPANDIWIPPRLGVERQWPKMEIPETRAAPSPRSAASPRSASAPQPPSRRVPRRGNRPVQDEWGFFDPEQCGFAALLAKLQEITEGDDPPAKRPA